MLMETLIEVFGLLEPESRQMIALDASLTSNGRSPFDHFIIKA
jgi:hypothetical protein